MRKFFLLLLCLCFALVAPATAFADTSARVLSVTPGVRYSLAGDDEALAVKMDVPIRAVVESDATGKAQLMFPDDSTLSIAPDTRIALAEYVDAEREENIVLNLVSGTARVITGESNRKNPQAFTVNTPQASIGIRGTLVTIQASDDVTRVYLSETSGLGVSVRNLNTGQVMELRKPGTIINVGANFMEERKASKEEAASYSAALRGKSRAAIQATTAQAEMQRAAAASITPEGTMPPAGGADQVQLASLTVADRLEQGSLVADATPAPARVLPPATSTAVPEAPNVPDVPAAPEAPNVPDVPAAPEAPNVPNDPEAPDAPEAPTPSGPGIVVDEGGLDGSVIEKFDVIADAIFHGNFDSYSLDGKLIENSEQRLGLFFPSKKDEVSSGGNVFVFPVNTTVTYSDTYDNKSIEFEPKMTLFTNGSFTMDSPSDLLKAKGKLTSPEEGTVESLTANFVDQGKSHTIELKSVNISR